MDRTSQIAFILSKVKGLPQLENEIKELAELLSKGNITFKQLFETTGIIKETILDAVEIYQALYCKRPTEDALTNWKIAVLEGKIFWIEKNERILYYDPA
jgi:NurA-like 5'-3' nuclease